MCESSISLADVQSRGKRGVFLFVFLIPFPYKLSDLFDAAQVNSSALVQQIEAIHMNAITVSRSKEFEYWI
jgi:hypothetical protein